MEDLFILGVATSPRLIQYLIETYEHRLTKLTIGYLEKKKVSLHLFSLRFVNVLWISMSENFRDINVSAT